MAPPAVLSYLRGHRHAPSSGPPSPLPVPSASSSSILPEIPNHHVAATSSTYARTSTAASAARPASTGQGLRDSPSWSSFRDASPNRFLSSEANGRVGSDGSGNMRQSSAPRLPAQQAPQTQPQEDYGISFSPPMEFNTDPGASLFTHRSRLASSSPPEASPVSLNDSFHWEKRGGSGADDGRKTGQGLPASGSSQSFSHLRSQHTPSVSASNDSPRSLAPSSSTTEQPPSNLSLLSPDHIASQHVSKTKVPSPWRMTFSRSGSGSAGVSSPSSADISPRPVQEEARNGGGGGGISRFTQSGIFSKGSPDTFGGESSQSSKDAKFDRNQPTSPKFFSSSEKDQVVEPVASQRSSKTKLNLLNPMSLLARRRSSQAIALKPAPTSKMSVPAIPEDYDPRIRGHIVHDFSAPRPRRVMSSDATGTLQAPATQNGYRAAPRQHYQQHGRSFTDTSAFNSSFNTTNDAANTEWLGFDSAPMIPDSDPQDEDAEVYQAAAQDQTAIGEGDITAAATQSTLGHDLAIKPVEIRDGRHNTILSPVLESAPQSPQPSGDTDISRQPTIFETSRSSATLASSPPKARGSRASRHSRNSIQDEAGGLPKHLTSSSSRFSFDMGGLGSDAQERILEERHKQKEAARKAGKRDSVYEDSEDDLDYDAMMADDGLEEAIPGVNADAEDYDEYGGGGYYVNQQSLQDFHFSPALPSIIGSPSLVQTSSGWLSPGPTDEFGNPIGSALTTLSTPLNQPQESVSDLDDYDAENYIGLKEAPVVQGLGVDFADATLPQDVHFGQPQTHMEPAPATAPMSMDQGLSNRMIDIDLDDDDLYFDDGNIDMLPDDYGGEAFDEAIFDDEDGHLYERKVKMPQDRQETLGPEDMLSPDLPFSVTSDTGFSDIAETAVARAMIKPAGPPKISGDSSTEQDQTEPDSVSTDVTSMSQQLPLGGSTKAVGLTEGNLAAYHTALVNAAQEAAANGRFDRQPSIRQHTIDQVLTQPQAQNSVSFAPETEEVPDRQEDDYYHDVIEDDFDFQDYDGMDDDAIIAEANAEALENDDEEFYGQEFGFYARAANGSEAEMVNGGFFGPKGADGVHRSHSGRVNFQEPSLTPITERSEWSARNSMVSLGPLSALQGPPVASPGLAQLVDYESSAGQIAEDDMTLSALIKLRRGAFGGSNGSLRSNGAGSSSGSPLIQTLSSPLGYKSSPTAERGPGVSALNWAPESPVNLPNSLSNQSMPASDAEEEFSNIPLSHARSHSHSHSLTTHSPLPRSPDSPSFPSSSIPTDTDQTPRSKRPRPVLSIGTSRPSNGMASLPSPSSSSVFNSSRPVSAHSGITSHSRRSSGADSVSYVKEADPSSPGLERWVLERRRTGETGQMELVGREVLGEGRI